MLPGDHLQLCKFTKDEGSEAPFGTVWEGVEWLIGQTPKEIGLRIPYSLFLFTTALLTAKHRSNHISGEKSPLLPLPRRVPSLFPRPRTHPGDLYLD